MKRLPRMNLNVMASLLLTAACAGPDEHRRPSETSALNTSTAAAERPTAGVVLDPESPLDVGVKPAAAKPHHHPASTAASAEPETVEDPVCHMKIKPAKAAGGSLTVNGVKSYFCSSSCRAKFLAANPEAK